MDFIPHMRVMILVFMFGIGQVQSMLAKPKG